MPTVVSFWPHPREVLHGEPRLRLDLPEEKLELLEPLGIRQLVLVPFTRELAALTPEPFVRQVLADRLQARRIAVGTNFRFGVDRSGDADDLARIGAALGIDVRVVPMLWDGAERVSSSRIRRALAAGDIGEAGRLLERPYRFSGRVVSGRGLGRQLGWPTANLEVDGRKFLPLEGVYAALVWRERVEEGAGEDEGGGEAGGGKDKGGSEAMPAVMNLGPQPTVDPLAPSAVEVHLLDRQSGAGGGPTDGAAPEAAAAPAGLRQPRGPQPADRAGCRSGPEVHSHTLGFPAPAGPVTSQPTVPPPFSSAGDERAAIERLLDANLDRAREGLRVLEDWARFALERPDLVARCKDLRQRLGRLHQQRFKLARHTATDPAAGMAHPAQAERQDGAAVVAANAGRVQEALRVLEEFGRLDDPPWLPARRRRSATPSTTWRWICSRPAAAATIAGPCCAAAICIWSPVRSPIWRGWWRPPWRRGCAWCSTAPRPRTAAAADAPADDRRRFAQASALRQLCHRHGALFLVNDRIDLALAVGADGVHLGQGDLPPAVARRLLGPERLIGRSTHRLEDLRQAVADGCDYVGVGPVNATPTKPGREPVGLAYVAQAAAESPLPFFAIGGIDAGTLAAVRRAGAERVAVVRAITAAPDPGAAAAALLAVLETVA